MKQFEVTCVLVIEAETADQAEELVTELAEEGDRIGDDFLPVHPRVISWTHLVDLKPLPEDKYVELPEDLTDADESADAIEERWGTA